MENREELKTQISQEQGKGNRLQKSLLKMEEELMTPKDQHQGEEEEASVIRVWD